MPSLSRTPGYVALAVASAALASALLHAQADDTYDLILRHGSVADGSGLPRFTADVGIVNGRIARVGDLSGRHAATEIDVRGLVVAPGFINIHSHATPEGLARAANMLTQGVTTEILNADGFGPVDLAAQRAQLSAPGLAVNIGATIGFNAVWRETVGDTDVRPTMAQIERMRGLVTQALRDGAFGVSAGLDYKPGYYATAEEVVRVVSVAKPWRTMFPNHERITPSSGYSSKAGIAETIAIGERAGLVPVVTHMKAQGQEQHTAKALLDLIRDATVRRHYAAADAYPYLAGQTNLAALLVPGWAQEGGRAAMLGRFRDPSQRARIVAEAEEAMRLRFGGPAGVYATGPKRELTDVMRELNVGAGEALVRLLEQADSGAILRFGAEDDLVAILESPITSVACDCGAIAGDNAHPRYYGTFPRVLGRYWREQRVLTLEDAVRKMTGLPAATIGMADRGLIAPGMAADVTVFDPATVIDRATFEQPSLPSEGIRHVIVNGRIALRDGIVTGAQAGRALTRSGHEPSRPMSTSARRSVQTTATVGGQTVRVSLRQEPGARTATGSVTVRAASGGVTLETVDLGVLQVAGDWASITARGRVGGQPAAITVIVEGADPLDEAHAARVVIPSDGGYRLDVALPRGSVTMSELVK